jgi:hypothetical protein
MMFNEWGRGWPKMSCHKPKIGKIELKMAFLVIADCWFHLANSSP